jgi:hypothetical protein
MAKTKEPPPLATAAVALADELQAFADTAHEIRRESLDTDRSMSRATRALTESVERQARIEQKLRALVAELDGVRKEQQASMDVFVEAAHRIEERAKSRDSLLARFAQLGASAGRVNALAVELNSRKEQRADSTEILERLGAMETEMGAVVAEAEALTTAATAENWPEIARQADGVRQQILAAKNKLALAHRNVAARAPS